MSYGSELWSYENTDIIEKLHLEFLKKITKSRKSPPAYMLCAEHGRYPLKVTIQTKMIKYWISIITGCKSKFSYMVYRHLLYRNRYCKWLTCIRNTLYLTGHSDLFLNQNNIRKSSYIIIKRTLIDQFIQEWNCKLEGSNKANQYKLFKDNIELFDI